MTTTMESTVETGIVVRQFSNGAYIVEFATDVQVGVDRNGRVYWATPTGWDFVLGRSDLFREKHFRILGDSTGWPTTTDSEFYAA